MEVRGIFEVLGSEVTIIKTEDSLTLLERDTNYYSLPPNHHPPLPPAHLLKVVLVSIQSFIAFKQYMFGIQYMYAVQACLFPVAEVKKKNNLE